MALKPIFYDTETTGVRADKDRIIEIAAYDPIEERSFLRFVNPGIPIPPDASQIHHITDEMVKDANPFAIVGKEFAEFCSGECVLIAHNNDGFDIHFLRAEFERNQLLLPKWHYFDTLKWARRYRSDLPRHSLQFLREHYQISANNAHRALDDVLILHQVFKFLVDDLSIEEIIQLVNVPKTIQHMPFGKHQGKPLKEIPKNYVAWLKSSGAFDKTENQELKSAFESLQLLNV